MGIGFGLRVRKLREARNLTQAEFAKLCGLGESTISFYESGKREPSYAILLKIAEMLETTPNYLLVGIDGFRNNGWWERNEKPTAVELERFILDLRDLQVFGEPIEEDIKEDFILAFRAAWDVLKRKKARRKPRVKLEKQAGHGHVEKFTRDSNLAGKRFVLER